MINSLLHLIYPALCVHCKELMAERHKLLCPTCEEQLTLLDPQQRCVKCFRECQSLSGVCKECQKKPTSYLKLGACFEHYGPGASLINAHKERLLLSKVLSSWMAVQLDKLHWPLPDLILPFPQSFTERFHDGYNRSQLLAEGLGHLFQIPVKDSLKKSHSQDATFKWKKDPEISDLTILLVIETLFSRSEIDECAKVIREGFPKAIYVLSFTIREEINSQDCGVPSGSGVVESHPY